MKSTKGKFVTEKLWRSTINRWTFCWNLITWNLYHSQKTTISTKHHKIWTGNYSIIELSGGSRLVNLVDFCLCTWSVIEFAFEIARRVRNHFKKFLVLRNKIFSILFFECFCRSRNKCCSEFFSKNKQEWYRKSWRNTMFLCDEKCLTRIRVDHCWIRFWAIVVLIFPLKQIVSASSASSSLSHFYVVLLSIFYVNNVSLFC